MSFTFKQHIAISATHTVSQMAQLMLTLCGYTHIYVANMQILLTKYIAQWSLCIISNLRSALIMSFYVIKHYLGL